MNKLVIVLSILMISSSIGYFFIEKSKIPSTPDSSGSQVRPQVEKSASGNTATAPVVSELTMEKFDDFLTRSSWSTSSAIKIDDNGWDYQFTFKKAKNKELSGGILFDGIIFTNQSKNISDHGIAKFVPEKIINNKLYFTVEAKDVDIFYSGGRYGGVREYYKYAIEIVGEKAFFIVEVSDTSILRSELLSVPYESSKKFSGKWVGETSLGELKVNIKLDFSTVSDLDNDFGSFVLSSSQCHAQTPGKFKLRMVKENVGIASVGYNACDFNSAVFKLVFVDDKLMALVGRSGEESFEMEFRRN